MSSEIIEVGERANYPKGNTHPIDMGFLRSFTVGDLQLEKEILDLFLAEVPKLIYCFERADTEKEWKRTTHTLKGAARSIGANTLADIACSLEERSDQWTNTIYRTKCAALLRTESENIKNFLETL